MRFQVENLERVHRGFLVKDTETDQKVRDFQSERKAKRFAEKLERRAQKEDTGRC